MNSCPGPTLKRICSLGCDRTEKRRRQGDFGSTVTEPPGAPWGSSHCSGCRKFCHYRFHAYDPR